MVLPGFCGLLWGWYNIGFCGFGGCACLVMVSGERLTSVGFRVGACWYCWMVIWLRWLVCDLIRVCCNVGFCGFVGFWLVSVDFGWVEWLVSVGFGFRGASDWFRVF